MQKKISEKSFDEFKNEPIEKLLNMSDRNLNTLLLELFNRRSKNIIPKDVYQKYNDFYEFFGPSKENLRNIIELDNLFLNCLPEKYEAIELSPITPFGANTCITKLSQKNILSTAKNSEVCSDATTALSYEACKKRKSLIKDPDKINTDVNMATIKKVLRMQQFDKSKGYLQHFGQFATITAGRKNVNFEYEKIKEHIKIWVNLLIKLKENNYSLGEINVGLCHINIIEHFIRNNFVDRKMINENSFNDFDLFKEAGINIPSKICSYDDFTENAKNIYSLKLIKNNIENLQLMIDSLKNEYPNVNFYIEMDRKGGLGYYVGSCFHIYSKELNYYVPLCDGGVPDWNKKILGDEKETSVVSGVGSELILNLYRRKK